MIMIANSPIKQAKNLKEKKILSSHRLEQVKTKVRKCNLFLGWTAKEREVALTGKSA